MNIAEKLATIAKNEQKVYEAGKKSQYDEFWDVFQDYGNRRDYTYGFAGNGGWDDDVYNPKYEIIVGAEYGIGLFRENRKITDTKVPIRILGKGANYVFRNCRALVRIPLYEVTEDVLHTNSFEHCEALTNITVGGVIGQDISFADSSLLTFKSLSSIINALKDLTDTGLTRILTLHAKSKESLNSTSEGRALIAMATDQKGWTIA